LLIFEQYHVAPRVLVLILFSESMLLAIELRYYMHRIHSHQGYFI